MVDNPRGDAPDGADTLNLTFSHQGRRDLPLAVRAWFLVAKLVAPLWIPAFAGMTGAGGAEGTRRRLQVKLGFRAIPRP